MILNGITFNNISEKHKNVAIRANGNLFFMLTPDKKFVVLTSDKTKSTDFDVYTTSNEKFIIYSPSEKKFLAGSDLWIKPVDSVSFSDNDNFQFSQRDGMLKVYIKKDATTYNAFKLRERLFSDQESGLTYVIADYPEIIVDFPDFFKTTDTQNFANYSFKGKNICEGTPFNETTSTNTHVECKELCENEMECEYFSFGTESKSCKMYKLESCSSQAVSDSDLYKINDGHKNVRTINILNNKVDELSTTNTELSTTNTELSTANSLLKIEADKTLWEQIIDFFDF